MRPRRRGFTLIEVMLACAIVAVGVLAMAPFYKNVYEQIVPRGEWGGLRRYMIAEEMLKAEAEGLRVLRYIPQLVEDCELVTPPAGTTYDLNISRTLADPAPRTDLQLYYYDLEMRHHGQSVATLSVSTLRSTWLDPDGREVTGGDDKLGL